jgi:hypothetical protein
MWCSGLGSNDRSNSNNNVDIRACVWGSEKLYVSSYHGDAAWDDDDNFAQDSKDSHVAVYANIAALRHTRLVHGVYTVISYGNKQHIAKMIAAKTKRKENEP